MRIVPEPLILDVGNPEIWNPGNQGPQSLNSELFSDDKETETLS